MIMRSSFRYRYVGIYIYMCVCELSICSMHKTGHRESKECYAILYKVDKEIIYNI